VAGRPVVRPPAAPIAGIVSAASAAVADVQRLDRDDQLAERLGVPFELGRHGGDRLVEDGGVVPRVPGVQRHRRQRGQRRVGGDRAHVELHRHPPPVVLDAAQDLVEQPPALV
jgi:hypothetical protein